ncbi:MAG: Cyclopropane-fatty-acyl-phospholipid synthase [Nocardia sp.]|nr:Cyclopropane-fatty-acyl-phospholipid synthase [Nocardia sp.]
MTEIVNTAQSEAWNGYEGEHWAGHYDRYDAVNGGFNAPLLAAAGIGETDRVLDIGCGNGQLTRLAARRASAGAATGYRAGAAARRPPGRPHRAAPAGHRYRQCIRCCRNTIGGYGDRSRQRSVR